MTNEQRIKNLAVPNGKVDVVLDTDAYNEIDDQFAIAYLLRSDDKLATKAIYAAPFLNDKVPNSKVGMEKSYDEILKLLDLLNKKVDVYKGAHKFLEDENTPVFSDAAKDLAERAKSYSPEKPLYVVAIGAITNVASAILINPDVVENTVVVWLGGNALHFHNNHEFNLYQDIAAARVVFKSGIPLIQLPCIGVVSGFSISKPELEKWFLHKNVLSDYLSLNTIRYMENISNNDIWSKPIWDVVAVAWLLNDKGRFMNYRTISAPVPSYDNMYTYSPNNHLMGYVYHIYRDNLLRDLIGKIANFS